VFENRVLRRIFGLEKDEVTGGWRKLHNEELHHLYCSPSIIRMRKARRMRSVRHAARMEEKSSAYRVLVQNLKETEHKDDLDVDRRIQLKWILDKEDSAVDQTHLAGGLL
jgi:hypothetical protein